MSTDYTDLATVKASLTLTGQTFADADITDAITSASRMVDGICGRSFYLDTSSSARVYNAINGGIVQIDDLSTLTSVASDFDGDGTFETSWTLNTDFTLRPYNYTALGWPASSLHFNPYRSGIWFPTWHERGVQVTGVWGWAAVPQPVVTATKIIATQLLRRVREAPFGIVTFGVDNPAGMRLTRYDPQIDALLGPYRKLEVI